MDPWIMLMGMQLATRISQMERKPPVTLALMGACVAMFLQPGLAVALGGGGGVPLICPAQHAMGARPWAHALLAAFVHAADGGRQ